MTSMLGRFRVAALASILVLGSAFAAHAEQVLHRGNGAEPETLDPHKATGVPEANILFDLHEGLLTLSDMSTPTPGVAEKWEISDDGKTYTFHLRANAKWSNGDPVTAEDFVYSLRRAVDPKTASEYAPILEPIVNAKAITDGTEKDVTKLGVEAVDAHTLKISLTAPAPHILGVLSHSISAPVHKATVEKYGDQWTRPGNSVTNGAYRIVEWTPQSQVVLEKNPNYWDAANVKIDKVVFYPTEDISEEAKRFRAGELQSTYDLPSSDIKKLKKELPAETHLAPFFGTYYYSINLTRDPLGKNLKAREALSMAIDRDALTDKITNAGELPAYGWVPPGLPGYEQQTVDYAKMSQADREAKAKALLKEAGYGPDKPLKVDLLYNTNENHKKIAIAIAGMWKKVLGVQTSLVNQEWKVYLESRQQKHYEVSRAGWIGDYQDPINFIDQYLSYAGVRNVSGYDDKKYDDLVAKSALTSDQAARFKLLEEAEKMFLDDHAMIPIYFYVSKHLVSQKVQGWKDNLLDYHLDRYLSLQG
jgi:oligopeptide transport system substrate-binding protein